MELPPAQDSPQHILNMLNDDCIEHILHSLKNAKDYLSAAQTCVRFQYASKMAAPAYITNLELDKVSSLREYLRVFQNQINRAIFHDIRGKYLVLYPFENIINGITGEDTQLKYRYLQIVGDIFTGEDEEDPVTEYLITNGIINICVGFLDE